MFVLHKEDLTAQGMNMREAVDNSRNRGAGEVLLRPHRRRTPDGGEIGCLFYYTIKYSQAVLTVEPWKNN